ncbi:hypothetical protein F383_08301 [Gossypium arboreum]|uniref:Uncharacterized protein n=1 Tax=Gossypium arboreum TaxID=29729 RepID=A0A0B0PFI1_GOSAR|nr:hypothetical protein F383_08301 [Gossypium arboreum]
MYHIVLTSFSTTSFLLPIELFGIEVRYSSITIDKYLYHDP